MIGATTMPRPQNPIAFPRCSGGNASSKTACDNGCSEPPANPCTMRKKINIGNDTANQQKNEDKVNPATDTISSRLRPK